jgi:hypothetical protein
LRQGEEADMLCSEKRVHVIVPTTINQIWFKVS